MKTIETRDVTKISDWIVEGTNIFIIPQAVLQSSDPTTKKFTIRHGTVVFEKDKVVGIIADNIENGADDFGGFETFDDVIKYLKHTYESEELIVKGLSMNIKKFFIAGYLKANKNNKLFSYMSEKQLQEKAELHFNNIIRHPALIKSCENRLKAWKNIYNECVDAKKRGVVKSDISYNTSIN